MTTVLITGASGGIGLELARRFARDGYDLVLVARRAGELSALADRLRRDAGVAVTPIPTDLADLGSPRRVVEALAGPGVTVDVLVNNAGVGLHGPFVRTSLDVELAMIRLNVTSLVELTKLLVPGMVARGRGRIVNVASTAGFQPGPLMSVYYATKAFVIAFSEALAEELAGTGVTVTTACPGATRTGFQAAAGLPGVRALQRGVVMDAADVADAIYRGAIAGRRLVIPGLLNRLHVQGLRLAPRRLVTRLVQVVNSRFAGKTTTAGP
jgi:short-subunit dehydrogenase